MLNGFYFSLVVSIKIEHKQKQEEKKPALKFFSKFLVSIGSDNEDDLNDTNSVSNIKCIVISLESDISFLFSIRSNQSVDFFGVDIVHFLDRLFDQWFVSTNIDNEDQCVVVFDLFHCRFGC